MTALRLEFGYSPDRLEISAGEITVAPLLEQRQRVADVESSEGVESDWIYAPLQQVRNFGGSVRDCPYPSRVFGLPKTHSIEHLSADSHDHLVFHVWALSFFTGTRLTTTEAGYLDATPLKSGTLVDFRPGKRSLEAAVSVAESFWQSNRSNPQAMALFAGAVHALFLGQNPLKLQFERFMLLYSAFDACFALAQLLRPVGGPRPSHAARVSWMCGLFGMPVPEWADPGAPSGAVVAAIRNQTVHEALFMGEPLGFALHGVGTGQNLTLEMEALICRLLVALIGGDDVDYVRSPIGTRQIFGLDLQPHP